MHQNQFSSFNIKWSQMVVPPHPRCPYEGLRVAGPTALATGCHYPTLPLLEERRNRTGPSQYWGLLLELHQPFLPYQGSALLSELRRQIAGRSVRCRESPLRGKTRPAMNPFKDDLVRQPGVAPGQTIWKTVVLLLNTTAAKWCQRQAGFGLFREATGNGTVG